MTYNELLQLMKSPYVCVSSCVVDARHELLRDCWRLRVYGEHNVDKRI